MTLNQFSSTNYEMHTISNLVQYRGKNSKKDSSKLELLISIFKIGMIFLIFRVYYAYNFPYWDLCITQQVNVFLKPTTCLKSGCRDEFPPREVS